MLGIVLKFALIWLAVSFVLRRFGLFFPKKGVKNAPQGEKKRRFNTKGLKIKDADFKDLNRKN